jgi:gas vesicle protein
MSEKHDRGYARTAQDLERKYSFGKTFADMLGLINENRDKVDAVESGLRSEIKEQSTLLKRDTQQIVMQATETVKTELSGDINDVSNSVANVKTELSGDINDVSNSVANAKTELGKDIDDVANSVTELTKQVNLKLDAAALSVKVREETSKGISLETGYTFDKNGLNISKAGEEMTNLLDNTGMYVRKSGDDILVANKDGVDAKNLHASTYLIIGKDNGRSRFEDYLTNRTACFWIGG